MQSPEPLGLRLWLGVVVGAMWSLVPAIFLHHNLLACFVAGMPTGLILTWAFMQTSREHPLTFGAAAAPIGTWVFFTLFGFAELLIAAVDGQPTFVARAPLAGGLFITFFIFITPLAFFPLLTSLASTYLFAAVVAKRPSPRRRDLLPERWDG